MARRLCCPLGYTLNRAGKDEDATRRGDLDINADTTITGAGYGVTIITGKNGWDDGILDSASTANVHRANLAIQHNTRSAGSSGGGGSRVHIRQSASSHHYPIA